MYKWRFKWNEELRVISRTEWPALVGTYIPCITDVGKAACGWAG